MDKLPIVKLLIQQSELRTYTKVPFALLYFENIKCNGINKTGS